MANPSHEERSLPEDQDMITRLVDYSSSSEDENPAPLPKKQRRSDSSDSFDSLDDGSSNSDLEEEQPKQSKTFIAGDDSDEEDIHYNNDDEFLNREPYSLRGSSNSDLEEDQPEQSKTFIAGDDSDEEDIHYNNDNEFLNREPYSLREIDKYNLPEVYAVFMAGKSPRTKLKCLKLLDSIGCQDRFLGCSIEMGRTFFANLNKDEAVKMEAVRGVHHVAQYRHFVFDV